MLTKTTYLEVIKKIWQLLFPFLDEPKVFFQVWRVQRQVGLVVLVEKLDLVIYVPGAFVARARGQKTASSPCGQECLHQLVPLRVRVAQVVTFIDEHEVSV